jgi:hypothetical protein
LKGLFVNSEKNSEGIYNIRLYVRGKPWIITIDDYLLFYSQSSSLVFSETSLDGNSIWGALLEKAWAKMKGNYQKAEGDMLQNTVRGLVGAPLFAYFGQNFQATTAK